MHLVRSDGVARLGRGRILLNRAAKQATMRVATVWPEPCVGVRSTVIEDEGDVMPMTQGGRPAGDVREPAALLAIGPEARGPLRILVVDDEHTLRESKCAAVLRHEGYDVTVCSRGQEALELLKRRPSTSCSWIYMSQVDGLALLRSRARNQSRHDRDRDDRESERRIQPSRPCGRAPSIPPQAVFRVTPAGFDRRAVHTLLVARETPNNRTRSIGAGANGQAHAARHRAGLPPSDRACPEGGADRCLRFHHGREWQRQGVIAQFITTIAAAPVVRSSPSNCAAPAGRAARIEMFGHRRAPSRARCGDKPGLLEAAHGGTLFLDELVEMPKSIQAKPCASNPGWPWCAESAVKTDAVGTCASLPRPTAIPKAA